MDGGVEATAVEANFDGLVGPTHHYGGLAAGNLASQLHAAQVSNPREAALQGLAKMRALATLGLAQGLLPPQPRPHIPSLRRLGFSGSDRQILERVARQAPELLGMVGSAASMWTANAATVSPGADCADGRVHFTPANLCTQLHRAIEAETTARVLRAVFADPLHFVHHPPLPGVPALGDEGAANHTRLCSDYGEPGLELFVYGAADAAAPRPQRYPARQTRLASESVARLHELYEARCFFVQQNPAAIDAGVFHNDVIAVGNRELLLYHEQAFLHGEALLAGLRAAWPGSRAPRLVRIEASEVSLAQAVSSYLFNSQLVCLPGGGMRLIVAAECREQAAVWACIQRLIADEHNPISGVEVFDLRQSMHNGGGPACLRLRVVLNQSQRLAVNRACWIDAAQARRLESWVHRHYRDRLSLADLADPQLLAETYTALDELSVLLELGNVYDFQLA